MNSFATCDEVLELVTAEAAVSRAKAELERCTDVRSEIRDRVVSRFPLGVWVEVFGVRIRRRAGATGDKFSLSKMRAAGKTLPKHLQRFVTPSKPTNLVDVEPAGDAACELEQLAERVATLAAAEASS
jgi:hypothetical protein